LHKEKGLMALRWRFPFPPFPLRIFPALFIYLYINFVVVVVIVVRFFRYCRSSRPALIDSFPSVEFSIFFAARRDRALP